MTEENDTVSDEEQKLFTQLVEELEVERNSEKYRLLAMLVLGAREKPYTVYCN